LVYEYKYCTAKKERDRLLSWHLAKVLGARSSPADDAASEGEGGGVVAAVDEKAEWREGAVGPRALGGNMPSSSWYPVINKRAAANWPKP
jgi:hypothetical protein